MIKKRIDVIKDKIVNTKRMIELDGDLYQLIKKMKKPNSAIIKQGIATANAVIS